MIASLGALITIRDTCHVDDMIATGSSDLYIREEREISLHTDIKIQYMGSLQEFSGQELIITEHAITIQQTAYLGKIRSRSDKQSLTPVSSPCEAGITLEKTAYRLIIMK